MPMSRTVCREKSLDLNIEQLGKISNLHTVNQSERWQASPLSLELRGLRLVSLYNCRRVKL